MATVWVTRFFPLKISSILFPFPWAMFTTPSRPSRWPMSCRLLTKNGGSAKIFSKNRLVEDSRYGKVFYVILSLQKDYKTAKEN